jgi:hypothetical protein
MSGGAYDYLTFKVMELCDEMEHKVRQYTNPKEDEWNPEYSKEHMELRQKFINHMRKVAEIAHTIEWVDSGDHSPEREIKELTDFFKDLK